LKSGAHVGSEEAVQVEVPDRAISIVGGFSHVCVGLESGEVFAWGFGEYGALGTGELKSSNKPVLVKLPHFFPKQISCGAMHSAFLTK
jgi:alpha-tubulin suppressor-like RCC1 family protein